MSCADGTTTGGTLPTFGGASHTTEGNQPVPLPGTGQAPTRRTKPTRSVTVGHIVNLLEGLYPPGTAEDWDKVGLVCGRRDAEVRTVLFAVDPVAEVVDQAIQLGADLLITHHPLLLRGVSSISADTYKGQLLHRLIEAKCALFTAHTNADSARPGVSDALARTLGLTDIEPLQPHRAPTLHKLVTYVPVEATQTVVDALAQAGAGALGNYSRCAWHVTGEGTFIPGATASPHHGAPGEQVVLAENRVEMIVPAGQMAACVAALRTHHPYQEPAYELLPTAPHTADTGLGRVGQLSAAVTLEDFARVVAKSLPYTVQGVRISGPPGARVHRVAVCGGAGDSLFDAVRASGADAYVTADLRHHPASEARETAGAGTPYLVDVAHWASEWPWLHRCAEEMAAGLVGQGLWVDYVVSMVRSDPWTFRIPSSGGLVR